MAMGTGGPASGPKSEINVTPLVDVVLVLLIIFMVVTPMLQRGKDVSLPKAEHHEGKDGSKAAKEVDPLVVSVTKDKSVYLESARLDDAALEDGLRRALAATPGRRVLVKGDESLTFGDVRHVMHVARVAGAKGVALAVEELKKD